MMRGSSACSGEPLRPTGTSAYDVRQLGAAPTAPTARRYGARSASPIAARAPRPCRCSGSRCSIATARRVRRGELRARAVPARGRARPALDPARPAHRHRDRVLDPTRQASSFELDVCLPPPAAACAAPAIRRAREQRRDLAHRTLRARRARAARAHGGRHRPAVPRCCAPQFGAALACGGNAERRSALWHTAKSRRRMAASPASAEPRSVQLAGADPQQLAEAARIKVDAGRADHRHQPGLPGQESLQPAVRLGAAAR